MQQGSPSNANRTREQVTRIEDKDDLVKRYLDCFDDALKRVPLQLNEHDDIKGELHDMESRGNITKTKESEATAC